VLLEALHAKEFRPNWLFGIRNGSLKQALKGSNQ
jgi:hypothetical protein